MSAADYSWGAGDVLGKLRAAEAALSRVKALADEWEREPSLTSLGYAEVLVSCAYDLRSALGGAA